MHCNLARIRGGYFPIGGSVQEQLSYLVRPSGERQYGRLRRILPDFKFPHRGILLRSIPLLLAASLFLTLPAPVSFSPRLHREFGVDFGCLNRMDAVVVGVRFG